MSTVKFEVHSRLQMFKYCNNKNLFVCEQGQFRWSGIADRRPERGLLLMHGKTKTACKYNDTRA